MNYPLLNHSIVSNQWIQKSWEDYLKINLATQSQLNDPPIKTYYHQGMMKLEVAPAENPHSQDLWILMTALSLFAGLHQINLYGHDHCIYRKTGQQDAQPDTSFYVTQNAKMIPGDITLIDLDLYPPPDLVIEVTYAFSEEDFEKKRQLYESLGSQEYWLIDVQKAQIWAFSIQKNKSYPVLESQVLGGLKILILEKILQRIPEMPSPIWHSWLLEALHDEV